MSVKRRFSEVVYEELYLGACRESEEEEAEGAGSKKARRVEVDRRVFTERYSQERGFGQLAEVAAERECYRLAAEARDEFKALRSLVEGEREDHLRRADLVGISRAQKYERRLQNNRRSAAVSKVFYEVLDCEKSHTIRLLANQVDRLKADASQAKLQHQEFTARIDALQDQNRKLREDNALLKAENDRVTSSVLSKSFASRSSSSQPSLRCSEDPDIDVNQFFSSQDYPSSQGIAGY